MNISFSSRQLLTVAIGAFALVSTGISVHAQTALITFSQLSPQSFSAVNNTTYQPLQTGYAAQGAGYAADGGPLGVTTVIGNFEALNGAGGRPDHTGDTGDEEVFATVDTASYISFSKPIYLNSFYFTNNSTGGTQTFSIYSDTAGTTEIGSPVTVNSSAVSYNPFIQYTGFKGIAIERIDISSGDSNFVDDDFSVTLVPEPSTWAIAMLGVGGLGVLAYRRRTSVQA